MMNLEEKPKANFFGTKRESFLVYGKFSPFLVVQWNFPSFLPKQYLEFQVKPFQGNEFF